MSTLPASRCDACALAWVPARDACPACGADVTPATAPAEGTVLSWTRVRVAPEGEPAGYVLALVALADGTRVLARAEPGAPDPALGGTVRVRVDAEGRTAFAPA